MTSPINPLEGIASLIQGIKAITDPDYQRRKQLEVAIAQDPNLAAQLKNNPQLLDAMLGRRPIIGGGGYDRLQSGVQSAPETAASTKDKADKAANEFALSQYNQAKDLDKRNITSNAEKQVGNTIGSIPGFGAIGALGAATQLNPQETQSLDEMRSKILGTKTTKERNLEDTNLAIGKANLAIDQDKLDTIAEDDTKKKYYQAQVESLKKRFPNTRDMLNAFGRGKLSPDEMSALEYFPETGKLVDDYRTEQHYENMERLQRDLQAGKMTADELQRKAAINTAEYLSKRTDGAVDIGSAYTLLTTPGLKTQMLSMPEPPTDPKGKAIWNAAQELKRMGDEQDQKRIGDAYKNFYTKAQPLIDRITGKNGKKGEDPDIVKGDIAALNKLSNGMFLGLGIDPLQFSYKFEHNYFSPNINELSITGGDPRIVNQASTDTEIPVSTQKAREQAAVTIPGLDLDAAANGIKGKKVDIEASLRKSFPGATPAQIKATVDEIKKRIK